ncbi:O-fucosyltransferase 38 [Tanacetum coccineum]
MVRVVVVRLSIVLIILIFIFNLYTTTRSILQLIPSSSSSSSQQQQQHETKLWQQLPFTHFHSCVNPSSNYQAFHGRGRYITIRSNGGLNQMRTGIADMVAVSRIMNATLVIPELDKRSFWQDKSIFSDIFDEHHFIDSLKWDVTVIKKLPEELLSVPRARKHFTSWGSLSYYQEMTKLWEDYQAYAVLVRNFDVRLSALAVTAHALQSFDVGQRKIVSFTANANEQVLKSLLSRLAPWDSSGLLNVVTSSSGSLGVQKRFGVDSPSLKIECSLPLWGRCSCFPLAARVPWSRFEPFVSSIVVNVAAVAVTVVAVVVESLVGLAKGRPALIQHDVGQRKIVSFTAKANEHVNGKCEEIQAGFSFA